MAKDDRLEIAWATFNADISVNGQLGRVRAVVKNPATHLYFGLVFGHPFLIVEDVALPAPAFVPWHSVASIGWVTTPKVEGVAPAEKVLK